MFIRELFKQKRFTLSFEFFPPKREGNLEGLFVTIQELSSLKPDFISVTYGAGGSTREKSLEIASMPFFPQKKLTEDIYEGKLF